MEFKENQQHRVRAKDVICCLPLILIIILMAVFFVRYIGDMNSKRNQKWHDFTVSNSCGIFEKNEKEGSISWKCADGIIYTKPDYFDPIVKNNVKE